MPLLWRYLLGQYLKVFTLCVMAFVMILLTMRLDEITYFATLGPDAWRILWFAAQQIPYIIPIALPVAALISSILLVQSLSQARELTALRASGFALRDILVPILAAALFLSALNFYIVSEVSTISHLNTGLLKNQLRSINPLILLHNKNIMRIKGFYFDALGASRVGEFARDIIFISPSRNSGRVNLMVAKQLHANTAMFGGHHVTLLTNQPAGEHHEFEHVILENMKETETTVEDFSQMLEKKIWTINNDHLRLPLLLVRIEEARNELEHTKKTSTDPNEIKQARYSWQRGISEILRRISAGLSVFSFTLMGLAFGISISRNRSNRGVLFIVLLAALYLATFLVAKNVDHLLVAVTLLYLLPQLIIFGASSWMLYRVSHGIE